MKPDGHTLEKAKSENEANIKLALLKVEQGMADLNEWTVKEGSLSATRRSHDRIAQGRAALIEEVVWMVVCSRAFFNRRNEDKLLRALDVLLRESIVTQTYLEQRSREAGR